MLEWQNYLLNRSFDMPPKTLRKVLGFLLLLATITTVSCQSMLEARVENAPLLSFLSR